MTSRETRQLFELLPESSRRKLIEVLELAADSEPHKPFFDAEMLYVECQLCGKPVLWEKGKTTALLLAAGVDFRTLDERCMILSEGCPSCQPHPKDGYALAVVRIAGLTPEEAVYMTRPGGSA